MADSRAVLRTGLIGGIVIGLAIDTVPVGHKPPLDGKLISHGKRKVYICILIRNARAIVKLTIPI